MSLGRVLVVDDEANVRKMVEMTLTKAGFDVVTAADGKEGITAIKSGDNPLMVDAIFCDIYMPKINGMEAVAYFRSQFPSVPVVVITGKPSTETATALFKQGVVDYLEKPLQATKLIEAAKKAVEGHKFDDGVRTMP